MSRLFHPAGMLALLLLLTLSPARASDRSPADDALQEGRIDQAIALLRAAVSSNPNDARNHNLLCRAFYAEEQPDPAIPECEAAVAHAPANSEFALWLGRVYGMKAEHSGPLTGFSMARRVRSMFERAVELNSHNAEALSDLGEFYVNAPAVVGGGSDKAFSVAAQLQPVSSCRGHRLLAQIAEKRSDDTTAESEFKAAVAAERTPDTLVDLGLFYARHQRYDEAVATLKSAAVLDRNADASLVDAARGFNDMKREPRLAIQLFGRYLASSSRSEIAPAPQVHVLLGESLAYGGDAAGARREYQAALALASDYGPARAALAKLPPS